jgi:flagellar hook assembly protein FlgD
VEIGSTYWYWLEAVEINGSGMFYGQPASVTVTGEVPAVLPTVTTMGNAYPNPFKQTANTTIDVDIKEGENGTVTIYNILGQVVQTFKLNEGYHKLNWNGQDARGNRCGSGIYFYKLSTPSTNMTKKMVLVK